MGGKLAGKPDGGSGGAAFRHGNLSQRDPGMKRQRGAPGRLKGILDVYTPCPDEINVRGSPLYDLYSRHEQKML